MYRPGSRLSLQYFQSSLGVAGGRGCWVALCGLAAQQEGRQSPGPGGGGAARAEGAGRHLLCGVCAVGAGEEPCVWDLHGGIVLLPGFQQ